VSATDHLHEETGGRGRRVYRGIGFAPEAKQCTCVLLRGLDQPRQRIEHVRRDASLATRYRIVIGVIGIVEEEAGEFAWCRIARDHVQMDVAVLVLQERVIEVIRCEWFELTSPDVSSFTRRKFM